QPGQTQWRLMRGVTSADKVALASLDHVVVVTPRRVPDALWRLIPDLAPVRRLLGRLGKSAEDRPFRYHLREGGTGITLGRLPSPDDGALPSAFRLLKLAGALVADALVDEPRTLGLLCVGFDADDETAVTRALLLALG